MHPIDHERNAVHLVGRLVVGRSVGQSCPLAGWSVGRSLRTLHHLAELGHSVVVSKKKVVAVLDTEHHGPRQMSYGSTLVTIEVDPRS